MWRLQEHLSTVMASERFKAFKSNLSCSSHILGLPLLLPPTFEYLKIISSLHYLYVAEIRDITIHEANICELGDAEINQFPKWFKNHINVLRHNGDVKAMEGLWALANGPFDLTNYYNSCMVNEYDVRRSSSQNPMQQLESEGVTEVSDDDVVAGLVREDLEPDEIDMQEFLKLRQENNSLVDEEEEYDDEKHAEMEEREKLDHFLDEMTWKKKIQNSSSHSATTARRRTTPTIAGHEALAPDITETLEVVESDASASKITSTQAPNINVPPARNIIITPGLNVNVTTAPNANAAPKLKRAVRGFGRGESSEKLVQKYGKLKILFLPGEAVLVDKDEQLSSAIGVIVKGLLILEKRLLVGRMFWLLAKTFAMLGLHLFGIEDQGTPRVEQIIDNKFQVAYTRWRYVLHASHKSLEAKRISPRSLSPRTYITLEKWKLACDFIEDEKYQL
ncbi:hypothetical protein OROMI_003517 [Orobanche minor]